LDQRRTILVRGVNWLGDVVMTTAALQRLREALPLDSITLLTDAKLAGLWSGYPLVDQVLSFTGNEGPLSIARRLRPHHFDHALIFPNSLRSALECFFARIPHRIGYARNGRSLLLSDAVRSPSREGEMRKRSVREIRKLIADPKSEARSSSSPVGIHHIHHYLHLAALLGANPEPVAPRIPVTAAERDGVANKFALNEFRDRGVPLFGINPGAEYGPAKRWPIERFAAVATEVQSRTGCGWIIFGGTGDQALAAELTSRIRSAAGGRVAALVRNHAGASVGSDLPAVVNLAGQTELRELCAALSLCSLLLTNDTGPMHLGAAVGVPVVALFGSTSPELTGPGLPGDPRHVMVHSGVACSPCFRRSCPIDLRCLNSIQVQTVVDALLSVVSRDTRS